MEIAIIAAVWLAIAAGIFGIYRLIVYLERRGVLGERRASSGGGSAYDPLQELVQPQARHVIQVEEQRVREDSEGGPQGGPLADAMNPHPSPLPEGEGISVRP